MEVVVMMPPPVEVSGSSNIRSLNKSMDVVEVDDSCWARTVTSGVGDGVLDRSSCCGRPSFTLIASALVVVWTKGVRGQATGELEERFLHALCVRVSVHVVRLCACVYVRVCVSV
jgi:hypothetical protein